MNQLNGSNKPDAVGYSGAYTDTYSGGGANTNSNTFTNSSVTNTQSNPGTWNENGSDTQTASYVIDNTWSGGSWVLSGTASNSAIDAGLQTASLGGNYSQVTSGTAGSNVSGTPFSSLTHTWSSNYGWSQSMNPAGTWSVSGGSGSNTDKEMQSWGYTGSGSGNNGSTISENGNTLTTSSFNIQGNWTLASTSSPSTSAGWSYSGTDNDTYTEVGHVQNVIAGTTTSGPLSGPVNTSQSDTWNISLSDQQNYVSYAPTLTAPTGGYSWSVSSGAGTGTADVVSGWTWSETGTANGTTYTENGSSAASIQRKKGVATQYCFL